MFWLYVFDFISNVGFVQSNFTVQLKCDNLYKSIYFTVNLLICIFCSRNNRRNIISQYWTNESRYWLQMWILHQCLMQNNNKNTNSEILYKTVLQYLKYISSPIKLILSNVTYSIYACNNQYLNILLCKTYRFKNLEET